MAGETPFSMRLPSELLSRVDAVAEELTRRAAGVNVSRTAVMRRLIERGLEILEPELGLTAKLRKKRG